MWTEFWKLVAKTTITSSITTLEKSSSPLYFRLLPKCESTSNINTLIEITHVLSRMAGFRTSEKIGKLVVMFIRKVMLKTSHCNKIYLRNKLMFYKPLEMILQRWLANRLIWIAILKIKFCIKKCLLDQLKCLNIRTIQPIFYIM